MKKALKITGFVLSTLILLVAAFLGYVAVTGVPTYDPPSLPKITVKATPERVARGEVIANIQCMECHGDKEGRLTGRQVTDVPEMFGKIFTKNITQDKEKGIGKGTDGELMYFLRTGIRKDGSYAFIMPQYPNLGDEDLLSLVAWLKSGRFAVQASKKEPQSTELSLFSTLLTHTVMKPLLYPLWHLCPGQWHSPRDPVRSTGRANTVWFWNDYSVLAFVSGVDFLFPTPFSRPTASITAVIGYVFYRSRAGLGTNLAGGWPTLCHQNGFTHYIRGC